MFSWNAGPLRVTVVGLHYAPEHSGNAPYTTGLARYLAACGHRVTALVGYPHYPEWHLHPGYERRRPRESDHGVTVRRFRHSIPGRPSALGRLRMESVFAMKTAWALLRSHPDVVVAVSPVLLSLIPAVLLRRVGGYRVGVWVQDIYGAALDETGLGSRSMARAVAALERWLLRRADGVVVIHEVFHRRLVSMGVDPARIEVVPNWTHVDPPQHTDVAAVRETMGWGADEVVVLHSGNMGVKQGLEGLVELGRAAASSPRKIRIVLMGDGGQREHLAALAADVPAVELVDPLPDEAFVAAMSAADVLVVHEKPGVVEMSVPSKLTSYFIAGRPVVAATHPRSGAAELVQSSGAGLVVPAGDPAPLLAAIEELADDPERATLMGLAGYVYASHHLTACASLEAHEAWLHGLVGTQPPGAEGHDDAHPARRAVSQ